MLRVVLFAEEIRQQVLLVVEVVWVKWFLCLLDLGYEECWLLWYRLIHCFLLETSWLYHALWRYILSTSAY